MGRRIFLTILWISFIAYAFAGAPPPQEDSTDLILRLSSGDWEGLNPAVVALFNAMGIWPMVYGCLVLVDGAGQKVPAWPFAIAAFVIGAFALLPYLILRTPNPGLARESSRLLALAESRWVGAFLTVGAVGVVGYGLWAGDWGNLVDQWRSSRFIHVMGLDFCLLWLLVPVLLGDDMARRGLRNPVVFGLVTLVPLVGAAGYLMLRPPLLVVPTSPEQQAASAG